MAKKSSRKPKKATPKAYKPSTPKQMVEAHKKQGRQGKATK